MTHAGGRRAAACFTFVEYVGDCFLGGTRLTLKPALNVLVGESGTGKTTVVETMRYAVTAGEPKSADARKLVQATLGRKGSVRLGWRSEHGVEYAVERAWGQAARVYDAAGTELQVSPEHIVRGDFFGSGAVQSIAADPQSQLELLCRFAPDEIADLDRELGVVVRELRDNGARLLELTRSAADLHEDAEVAAVIEERLKGMTPAGGPDAAALRAATAERGMRERETHALDQAERALRTVQASAQSLSTQAARQLGVVLDDALLTGPNRIVMRGVGEHLDAVAASFSKAATQLDRACEAAAKALAQDHSKLGAAHATQNATYAELVARDKEAAALAAEREDLQKKFARAAGARKTLELRQSEKAAVEARHRELIAQLSSLRDKRFAVIKRVSEQIEAAVQPTVRVLVRQGESDERYRELLAEGLGTPTDEEEQERREAGRSKRAPGMKVAQVVDNIAANVLPTQLASLVMRGDADQLAELGHLTQAQAAKTIERLAGTEALFDIERVELGDTAHIELKVDDKYQDVSEASRGQRGTAILPLLLLLGRSPFVMDQPEDDLFARFKTSTIAKLLAKVKADRQVIVTTHDPNLVVLPQADQVIELGASKSKGYVRGQGAAVDRRDTIEELDGGAEAFLQRKDFYGH